MLAQFQSMASIVLVFAITVPAFTQQRVTPQKALAVESLPPDKAILDVDVSAGTRVWIAGEEVKKFFWTYHDLHGGRVSEQEVIARFPNGGEARRQILLRGGWHVRVPLRPVSPSRPEIALQTGHEITWAEFSPDNEWLATGCFEKSNVILWQVETGRQIRAFPTPAGQGPIAFHPDGKQLIVCTQRAGFGKNQILFRDIHSGELTKSFACELHWISSVSLSPDGRRLLAAGRRGDFDPDPMIGRAFVWDIKTGTLLQRIDYKNWLAFARFLGNDELVLAASSFSTKNGGTAGEISVWNVDTGRKTRFLGAQNESYLAPLALSRDGRALAARLEDPKDAFAIIDVSTGQRTRTIELTPKQRLERISFSADGNHVVTASIMQHPKQRCWEVTSWHVNGKKLRDVVQGGAFSDSRTSALSHMSISPDGQRLFVAESGRGILYEFSTGKQVRELQGSHAGFSEVAFSSLGVETCQTARSETVVADYGLSRRSFEGKYVAYSAEHRLIITRGATTDFLWDVDTGRKLLDLPEPLGQRNVFCPDGRTLISFNPSADDIGFSVYDLSTGKRIGRFRPTADRRATRMAAAISADSTKMAISFEGEKPQALLLDLRTGARIYDFPGWYPYLRFPPKGDFFFAGQLSGYLFRTVPMEIDRVLFEQKNEQGMTVVTGGAQLAAFTEDGQILAYALNESARHTVTFWSLKSFAKLRTIACKELITDIRLTGDGRQLLTRTVHGADLWDVATGDRLATLVGLKDSNDSLVVTPEGLFDGTENGRNFVNWRIAGTAQVVPVDRFYQDFYHAGLLAALRRGERPFPEVELARVKPPQVRIVSPANRGSVENASVTLDIEVLDQGGGIQGPWLFHNGSRVLAPGETQKDGNTLRRKFSVVLVEGENRLEVKAASDDGSWESEPARILLRYERPLEKAELHVLAVGINHYAEGSMNLKFARDDAGALAELFDKRGTSLYKRVHVTKLIDGQATTKGIRQALQDISKKARPQDTLIVFLGGHGTLIGQRYYFVPHEFKRQEGKSLEDDLRQQCMPADVLGDYLGAVPALKRVLVFDTCHSGGAIGLSKTARNPFAFRGAIERLSRAQGVFTIAATAAGDEAQEVSELGHGVLTYTLLAGLGSVRKGPLEGQGIRPSNPERVADVLEWFSFASGQVPRLTRRYFGREQDVQTSGHGSSFPVLPVEDR